MTDEGATGGDGPRGERIAKWLARAGVASRRDGEKLIAEGRVRLDANGGWNLDEAEHAVHALS